jgi:hypothetical protein
MHTDDNVALGGRHQVIGRVSTDRHVKALVATLAGACGIHLGVIEEHLAESPIHGIFFIVLSLLEAGFAASLIRRQPSDRLTSLIMLVSLGTVAIWGASRTVGIPDPAESWMLMREQVGWLDVVATILEMISVVASALVLTARIAAEAGAN